MLKNYFKTALRNFRANKLFTAINIIGLAIGISTSLVIFLIVQYEFNFDKFEKGNDQIYRVVTDYYFGGSEFPNSGVTAPLGNAVQNEVSGIEYATPFYSWNSANISISKSSGKSQLFKDEENIVFVNENYFKLIGYAWLAGAQKNALKEPYEVVLTDKVAQKYFPATPLNNIIGSTIIFDDSVQLKVTGIVKSIEENTDFTFTTFISRATLENTNLKPDDWNDWGGTNSASQLYVKLLRGADTSKIRAQVQEIYNKNTKKDIDHTSVTNLVLQPLSDLHFNSKYGNYTLDMGNKPTLYGLIAIAIFLLLLGCINFINLTTARAVSRSKEIGIRKTLGSSKKQLAAQILSETFLLTIAASICSVLVTPLLLKAFSDFIPEGLHFSWQEPLALIFILGITILVAFLAGIYPAFVLSSYKPVLILKNQATGNHTGQGNATFRKALTVFQFVIAQVFIIATMIVSKQIDFSLSKDMGFKKDAIIYFSTNYKDTSVLKRQVLLQKLKAIPGIASISLSNPPASNGYSSSEIKYNNGKNDITTDVLIKNADTNYIKLFKIKLLAGENLPANDNELKLLINETYSKTLGFKKPADAIGKFIDWNDKKYMIAGIVADFNTRSLREKVKPLLIIKNNQSRTFNISLMPQAENGHTWQSTIAAISKSNKEVYPEDDIDINFLDETIAKFYTADQHISTLLKWATGLSVFISCLGLFGLVIYTANQRKKEIGIRKVIGAGIVQIILLLSKDFIKLILLAALIALPVAWYAADKWLENFAYKTEINIWIFILGGVFLLLPAMIILLIKTYKAAAANPVESLRSE
ncbi:MAG: ABC transporter permease [Bacteroidota bacterium]